MRSSWTFLQSRHKPLKKSADCASRNITIAPRPRAMQACAPCWSSRRGNSKSMPCGETHRRQPCLVPSIPIRCPAEASRCPAAISKPAAAAYPRVRHQVPEAGAIITTRLPTPITGASPSRMRLSVIHGRRSSDRSPRRQARSCAIANSSGFVPRKSGE